MISLSDQQQRECEGILAMFSVDNPIVVHPAFYKILKDAGLPMERVKAQETLLMFGSDD